MGKTVAELMSQNISNAIVNAKTWGSGSATYSFNMQAVRDVVYRTAKDGSIDFIDNYSIFNGFGTNYFTSDGLHPNEVGYRMMADNIIRSLEAS